MYSIGCLALSQKLPVFHPHALRPLPRPQDSSKGLPPEESAIHKPFTAHRAVNFLLLWHKGPRIIAQPFIQPLLRYLRRGLLERAYFVASKDTRKSYVQILVGLSLNALNAADAGSGQTQPLKLCDLPTTSPYHKVKTAQELREEERKTWWTESSTT